MQMSNLNEYLDSLQAKGVNHFTSNDFITHLGLNKETAQVYLSRLKKKKLIASPLKTFHLIIPPEFRILGCLPPEQFIDYLMKHIQLEYYVGLLTSSDYYGACHHKPQTYQVLVTKSRRPIRCGKVRIEFFQKTNLNRFQISIVNTKSGTLKLATPELTAFDLIGYEKKVAGLNNVVSILGELLNNNDKKMFMRVAKLCPISWSQRLAYLAFQLEKHEIVKILAQYIETKNATYTPLFVGSDVRQNDKRDVASRVIINEQLDLEEI